MERDAKYLGHFLKLWGDPFGYLMGEVKGGHVALNFHRLWITSNYSIEEIFGGERGDPVLVTAIRRRFTEIHMASRPDSWGSTWNYWCWTIYRMTCNKIHHYTHWAAPKPPLAAGAFRLSNPLPRAPSAPSAPNPSQRLGAPSTPPLSNPKPPSAGHMVFE